MRYLQRQHLRPESAKNSLLLNSLSWESHERHMLAVACLGDWPILNEKPILLVIDLNVVHSDLARLKVKHRQVKVRVGVNELAFREGKGNASGARCCLFVTGL